MCAFVLLYVYLTLMLGRRVNPLLFIYPVLLNIMYEPSALGIDDLFPLVNRTN